MATVGYVPQRGRREAEVDRVVRQVNRSSYSSHCHSPLQESLANAHVEHGCLEAGVEPYQQNHIGLGIITPRFRREAAAVRRTATGRVHGGCKGRFAAGGTESEGRTRGDMYRPVPRDADQGFRITFSVCRGGDASSLEIANACLGKREVGRSATREEKSSERTIEEGMRKEMSTLLLLLLF